MKIIFLDIDGVLNHGSIASAFRMSMGAESGNVYDGIFMLPERIETLNKIVEKIDDVGVVITSTHKLSRTAKSLNTIFKKAGFKGSVVGVTPTKFGSRDQEIEEYLDEYIGISDFVIVDDMDMMGKLTDKLVCTPCGLSDEHVEEVVNRLSQPPQAF